jgi:tetratricopeptide (TPR) repeat protein
MGATQQYYPVLHSAFWIEHRLWGDNPVGYHLLNVLLHAAVACLAALALRRLGQSERVAWLAAFLFALHPVAVESVAWISEQKNTLSAFFYLLAALAYLRFDRDRGRGWYGMALGCFGLALLSKSVTATLPAALLVIFWWRRGRLSWRRDVLPLAPWFALGAATGLLTAWVERKFIGAEGAVFSLSLLQRGLLAGRVVCFYLGKVLWPAPLSFVYPRWSVDPAAPWAYLFPLAVAATGLALWRLRRRGRGPLAAFLFFVGTLFPALGFVNVYPFIFSYVADHFQYLAMLGVIALAAAAWERWARGSLPVAAAVLGVLGALTWRQAHAYRDAESLYRVTLDRNPASWLAHDNLGVILAETGRLSEALPHYEAALRLRPDYPLGYYNLGNALARAGRIPEAIAAYREALRLKPDYFNARNNLGAVLVNRGDLSAGAVEYEAVLRLEPDHLESQFNLASILVSLGRPAEAIPHYEAALRLQPGLAAAHAGLAGALASLGRFPEAIAQDEAALRLRPGDPEIRRQLDAARQQAAPRRATNPPPQTSSPSNPL